MASPAKSTWTWLKKSVWTFPLILLLIVLALSAFKISGSSVGIYHKFFYGNDAKDPDLIFAQPRLIRSDEYLVSTQMTIAQAMAGYPKVNQNVGEGMDMSVLGDQPYKEWSAIFRPHNLAFLVLPLEYAFAFKWWFMLWLLITSCYFFCLRILPGKKTLALLLALGFGLSPFIWWWLLGGTVATLFFGFLILIMLMRIFNNEAVPFIKNQWLNNGIQTMAWAYVLTGFALVLYPPYQIPITIVMGFFGLGLLIQKARAQPFKKLIPSLAQLAVGTILAAVLVGLFVLTRADTFRAINGTVYPSDRNVKSGGLDQVQLTSGFLQPQLQYEPKGYHFITNQSESSNFILLLPFLLLPGFVVLAINYRKRRKVDWLLLMIQLCALLLLARVFIPFGDAFYKLLLLDKVPHGRLIIAFGFLSFIQMLLVIKNLKTIKLRRPWVWMAYGLVCLAVLLLVGAAVKHDYPNFLQNLFKASVAAVAVAAMPTLILLRKYTAAACLIILFSFICVWKIHPLYRGLGPLYHGPLNQAIQSLSQPEDTWVAADSVMIENHGALNGRDSLSGINYYPNLGLWRQVAGPGYDDVYNRYAHIIFSSSQLTDKPLALGQFDVFLVKLDCSQFITQRVEYVLSSTQIKLDCLEVRQSVDYPALKLYLYELK